jgi:hypothetical protein
MCKNNCTKCKNIRLTMATNHDNYSEIDVGYNLKNFKNNRRGATAMSSHKQRKPIRILGNMKQLGWEVYTGVQFSLSKYQNLQAQLRDCVRGRGSNDWHGIGGTNRSAFKIDDILADANKRKIMDDLPLIESIYNDIRNVVLKQVPYLKDNVKMEGRSLLANMGQVDEQVPHRDFKEIKK